MRNFFIFTAVFLFLGGIFSANAQDLIILKDESVIEAKVLEISTTEVKYKHFDYLDGPTIVLPTANVQSIKYENGRVETINADISTKNKTPAMDPDKLYFSVAADPSGILRYGPSVLIELTKNHQNTQFYVSLPSLGMAVKSDGFGIGAGISLNYLWHTKIGNFYLGGLFDYSGYKVNIPGLIYMPVNGKYTDGKYDYPDKNLWQSNYSLALNLGFKFVFSSGLYFTAGGSAGGVMLDDIRKHGLRFDFFVRPNVSAGYTF
jgi:hypothetical protein